MVEQCIQNWLIKLSRSAVIFVNFWFDFYDGIDEEWDDASLVGIDRIVHAGDLVAGVCFNPVEALKYCV